VRAHGEREQHHQADPRKRLHPLVVLIDSK
jgi:hypothetical protein